jgi:mRNA interferase MazF
VLTRDTVIDVLSRITVAPITRTVRGIHSEVSVGLGQGLTHQSVITCDNVMTIPKTTLEPEAIGMLTLIQRRHLDRALRYSLAIRS